MLDILEHIVGHFESVLSESLSVLYYCVLGGSKINSAVPRLVGLVMRTRLHVLARYDMY